MNTFILFLALALNGAPPATNAGAYWHGQIQEQYIITGQLLKMTVDWELTEPQRGVYNWALLDYNIPIALTKHAPVMLSIHRTPTWARTSPYKCKLPDNWSDLAHIIQLIIDRYHPESIAVWNEPEMPLDTSISLGYCCGCLDPNEYRQLINYLRTAVNWGATKLAAGEFVMIYNWMDQFFAYPVYADTITFHYYTFGWDLNPLGFVLAKAYLEGKTDLPLRLTETALLCNWEKCADTFFRAYQGEWLKIVTGYGIPVYWYNMNADWKNCAMLIPATGYRWPSWYRLQELIQDPP